MAVNYHGKKFYNIGVQVMGGLESKPDINCMYSPGTEIAIQMVV